MKMYHRVALVASLALSSLAIAGDWPQWRGPNRDAVSSETGLLKQWPADGPKQLWKTDNVGKGFSSVSVVKGKLFTMGDRAEASYLICIDANTGKELWVNKIGKTGGSYSGTRSTPTVDGDRVYALGQFGDLVCCENGSGKEVWRKNLMSDFGGKKGDGWSYSESVLIDDKQMVCTPGGMTTMVAIDKTNGQEIWRGLAPGNPGAGHSSIVVATVGGIRSYITLTAGGVVSFQAKDGKFLWEYGKGKIAPNTANIPTCIVRNDEVFCTAGYGKGGALLKLTPVDGGITVKEVWFDSKLNNKHGGVVFHNGHLYGDRDSSGFPWCARWETGEIVWQRKARTQGGGSAAVLFADGNLYIRYDNGYMVLAEAGTESYKEISAFKIPNASSQSWSHPVIANGKLYIKEQNFLMCYDIKE